MAKQKDIRDFLKDSDRENITSNKCNNVTNNLCSVNYTYSAEAAEIKAKPVTSSPPVARIRDAVPHLKEKDNVPPQVVTIGISVNHLKKKSPDRRTVNVSITWDDSTNKQFSCSMVNYGRKRELKGTIAENMRDWYGYDAALDFMKALPNREDSYVGKLRDAGKYIAGVPQKLPIVPKTSAVMYFDENDTPLVMLWLGDAEYIVELRAENLSKKQTQFYMGSGYWRKPEDVFTEDMF